MHYHTQVYAYLEVQGWKETIVTSQISDTKLQLSLSSKPLAAFVWLFKSLCSAANNFHHSRLNVSIQLKIWFYQIKTAVNLEWQYYDACVLFEQVTEIHIYLKAECRIQLVYKFLIIIAPQKLVTWMLICIVTAPFISSISTAHHL